MATYVPNATQTSEPVESQTVESAALEFRTLKTRVNSLETAVNLEDTRDLRVPEAAIAAVPAIASRAGKVLGFDAGGDPVVVEVSGATDPSLRADLAASSGAGLVGYLPAGTGAVARTVQSKLRESVSVMDFMTAAQIADVQAKTFSLDVTAAVQTALASGPVVVIDGGYKITDTLTVTDNITTDGTWPEFRFACGTTEPTTLGALVYVTGEADILGLKVTAAGSSQVQYGVFVDASTRAVTRTTNYDVIVSDLANSDNTKACQGFVFYTSSTATNTKQKATIKAQVSNITATANSEIGDAAGSARGVLVSINGSGSDNDIEIIDSSAIGIYPAEDGDGIHIYVADHTSTTAKGRYRITNAKTSDCAKRGIKTQAQNCVISNPYTDCDLVTAASGMGIDCYGVNTTIENPMIRATYTNDGIAGRANNFKLINPNIRMELSTIPIRIVDSENFEVLGGSVYTGQNFATNSNTVISVTNSSGYILAPECLNAFSKGSVVFLNSVPAGKAVVIDIPVTSTCESLIKATYCVGTIHVKYGKGTCTGSVIDVADCNDLLVTGLDATTTGAYGIKTLRSTYRVSGTGRISGMTTIGISQSGVAAGTGKYSVSGDWKLVGNGAAYAVDLSSTANSECIGLYSEGFTSHIFYNYSTNAFIGNNRARGAGTHLVGTGATGAVLYNNNLIV